MKIESVKIVDGKLLLKGEGREFYLMDGIYRSDDGEAITVNGHGIVTALAVPNLESANKKQLEVFITDLKDHMSTIEETARLANIDLQNALQRQQQSIQTMSNVSKVLNDTAMAIIRKIG